MNCPAPDLRGVLLIKNNKILTQLELSRAFGINVVLCGNVVKRLDGGR
jgi:hypothetical protein